MSSTVNKRRFVVEYDESSGRGRMYERREDGSKRFVGLDGGEPEDASFARDYDWVDTELNKLVDEIESLKAAIARQKEETK